MITLLETVSSKKPLLRFLFHLHLVTEYVFLNCKQLGGGVKLSIPELYVVTTVCKPSM